MRVAELDMTDNTTQCPDNLELRTTPLCTCTTVNTGGATCSSDTFSVDGVQHSKVCGRIRAYQMGTTNAFAFVNRGIPSIDTYYVDGVSLTYGSSRRQHVWTFASAANEEDSNADSKFPCTNNAISSMIPPPPQFVGNHYFCNTAVAPGQSVSRFHSDDPL